MEYRVEPIGPQTQQQIEGEVTRFIALANIHHRTNIPNIPVRFDLTGSAAGMYCTTGDKRWFRFNPYLFGKFFEENFCETVPHEVAHYVVDVLFGGMRRRGIKAHGREWKAVMALFGVRPKATHNHDLSGIPVRRQERYDYFCNCRVHQVSATKHNRIQRKRWQYVCVKCGETLRRRAARKETQIPVEQVVQLELFTRD